MKIFAKLGGQAPLVFVLLAGGLLFATGTLRFAGTDGPSGESHAGEEGHGPDDGHGHGADWCEEHGVPESECAECGGGGLPPSASEDFAARAEEPCEHDVAIVDCDSCRFEIGVVRVDPSLADRLLLPAPVLDGPAGRVLVATGEIRTDRTRIVDVPATAPGRILSVECDLGQRVRAGDRLAVIHSGEVAGAKAAWHQAHTAHEIACEVRDRRREAATALDALLAKLDRSGGAAGSVDENFRAPPGLVGEWKAKLLSAAGRLRQARLNHEREHALTEKGISSRAENEAADQDLQSARAGYEALVEEVRLTLAVDRLRAENDAKQAAADLLAAEQRLRVLGLGEEALERLGGAVPGDDFGQLEIRAPRDGAVTALEVVEGGFVDAGDRLFEVADQSVLWTWCDVYERDLAALALALSSGDPLPASLEVTAFPGRAFPGRLDLLDNRLDEHTRTVKARVVIDNPDGLLRPGMYATVEVVVRGEGSARLVPRSAVLTDEGAAFVFLRWRDDLWVRRDVEIEGEFGDHVHVRANLPDDAVVAAGGAFMLKSDVLQNKMGAG